MPKLPTVAPQQLVKFFEHHGFVKDRQNGSHIIMIKPGAQRPVVVPENKKEVSVAVMMKNLKTAGVTKDDLVNFLRPPKHRRK